MKPPSSLPRSTKPLARKPYRWKPGKVKTHTTKDGRLILSLADWIDMKWWMWKLAEAEGMWLQCGICHQSIHRYTDFEPDHIIPRGMGGGTRDDRPENLQPSHKMCNSEKGSKRP